jgi:hypothetical protein
VKSIGLVQSTHPEESIAHSNVESGSLELNASDGSFDPSSANGCESRVVFGAVVSTMKLRVAEPELPAVSVFETVTECVPSARTDVVSGDEHEVATPPSIAQVVGPVCASAVLKTMFGVESPVV